MKAKVKILQIRNRIDFKIFCYLLISYEKVTIKKSFEYF